MRHPRTLVFVRPVSAAGLLMACALLGTTPSVLGQAPASAPAASQPAASTVRPEFAKPVQEALTALNEGRAQEAMARLDAAAAVPNLTPYERMLLERNRGAIAMRLGDNALMLKSLEAALATGLVEPADEVTLTEAMVGIAAREADHARVLRWSQRHIDLKGPSDSVRILRIQTQAVTGDERGAIAALLERQAAADKAGSAMPEAHLRLLFGLQQSVGDAGETTSLERLAVSYPRPEYWSALVAYAVRRVGDNERARAELYRLLRATGSLTNGSLRDDLAQIALRIGQPAEALAVIEEGFAAGLLGTGPNAAEHQKMRDQARKQAASDVADRPAAEAAAKRAADGNALVNLGWSMVTALPTGAAPATAEPGLALIEQGFAKGGLRRANEARLHLGAAQIAAGRKEASRKTLAALAAEAGTDPLAEPIRLWSLWAAAPAMLPKLN